MKIVKIFLALVAAATLGACAGIDQKVDGFLMDQGWLVSSNTNYSNSTTRDYEAWRGDSYRRSECTDYSNYNRSTNRWFDYGGNKRYDTSMNRGWNQSCYTERFYPRLGEPRGLIAPGPEARPRFDSPPPSDKKESPPSAVPPPPPSADDTPAPPPPSASEPPAPRPSEPHPKAEGPKKDKDMVQF